MEKTSKPAQRSSSLMQILFGALLGILLGIAGVLIYQGYLGQITNILLYVSLVFFGVIVLTFILVWGFKIYLTRLIFGSKVADSPNLIAEAQQMTDQLSSNVINKLLEKATEEDKEKVKGLVIRLGNWFLWGRLRNWWWNWILGIFVSLGGLTGTLLLVNQNELLQNQNNLVANQTELLNKQNKLIENQMSLEEASRRGSLVMLMSNIFDKVDDEIAMQKAEMMRRGKKVNDDSKFAISQSLIGQIAALSQAFKPYRFMDGDTLIGRPLSPERGQLLMTICGLPLDTATLDRIFANCPFLDSDLRGVYLDNTYLSGAYLAGSDFSNGYLHESILRKALLLEANLTGVFLDNANLANASLIGADLHGAHLEGTNVQNTEFMDANLSSVNLSEVVNLSDEQVITARTLYKCKLPKHIDVAKLKKEKPELFRK